MGLHLGHKINLCAYMLSVSVMEISLAAWYILWVGAIENQQLVEKHCIAVLLQLSKQVVGLYLMSLCALNP